MVRRAALAAVWFGLLVAGSTGCSVIESGPDQVELLSEPPGATVRLRGGGRTRTLPGVTPMTIGLVPSLPDPIEIEFHVDGYVPVVRRLQKIRSDGLIDLRREDWRWPTEPIRVRLARRTGAR